MDEESARKGRQIPNDSISFAWRTLNLPSGVHSQDRVGVVERERGLLVLLADGAGGVSGGAAAAQSFVDYFTSVQDLNQKNVCQHFANFDSKVQSDPLAGDTTGIAIVIEGSQLFGASVGDSDAWFLPAEEELIDLTGQQMRKPLLGSGEAMAEPFSLELKPGLLLLGSDGLHKYADYQKILSRLRGDNLETLTSDLADLARLPSGKLQDDISIVVVLCQSCPSVLESGPNDGPAPKPPGAPTRRSKVPLHD